MKGRVIPFSTVPRSRRPPAAPAAEPSTADVAVPQARGTARYAAGHPGRDDSGWQGPPLDGVRIMVVEHDEESREALVSTLQQWGAAVSSFTGMNDATAGLDAVAPDAVILAIRMPGDPYRFIAALRRQDGARRHHTPLLAVVGDVLDRRRAASAGINLYVARPLDAARLRLTLANLVRAAA
jgi:CheY-like chemotaxis protein